MNRDASFIYSPSLLNYRFSDTHPFNPLRLRITVDLLREAGLLDSNDVVEPRSASKEELALVHSVDFLQAVERASDGAQPEGDLLRYELGTEDVPVFEGMHEEP